jgi:hypothetical protein
MLQFDYSELGTNCRLKARSTEKKNMAARPSKELPANYSRFWQFDLTRVQDLFWLNLAGILLFFAAALVFAFLGYWLRPQVFSLQTLFAPAPAWQLLLFLGEVLAVSAVMIIVHEGFHGLFFWVFSHSRPKFAFKIYYAYTAAPGWYFPRGLYFIISLAPLAGITLLGIMGFLFLPAFFNIPMYLLLVLNTGGAVGDLWAVVRLIFSPSSTLIHDCGDAIEFFRPQ